SGGGVQFGCSAAGGGSCTGAAIGTCGSGWRVQCTEADRHVESNAAGYARRRGSSTHQNEPRRGLSDDKQGGIFVSGGGVRVPVREHRGNSVRAVGRVRWREFLAEHAYGGP